MGIPLKSFDWFNRAHFRFLAEEDGARIVGVIEREGAVWRDGGLPVTDLAHYRAEHGTVEGFPGVEFIADGAAVLEGDCDLLIPAAGEARIHPRNAERIRAPLIAEAANGPVTFEADGILNRRGITVLPDILANAGGVTDYRTAALVIALDKIARAHRDIGIH